MAWGKLSTRSLLLLLLSWPGSAVADSPGTNAPADPVGGIVLPAAVPDPIEPFNRTMWAINRGLLVGIVKPTSKIYRFVVRKPVRKGISNFGRNITYPGRLINLLLQARWHGARQETDRFFCNTIAGGAGVLDIATRWNIPKAEADFGQTFGRWGWTPTCFIMLPVFGPSNERDFLGLAADSTANPLTYITPYSITTENPLTFFSPYVYFSYAMIYNNLTDTVDDYARFVTAEADPYALVQYAWTFVRATDTPDLCLSEPKDQASLETLRSAMIAVHEPKFPDRASTRSVRIPATGRKLKYDLWLQPGKAPLVYLVPGLGSHRRVELALALAELLQGHGYSVVTVSSPFHPEFMESAAVAPLPAHAGVDTRELLTALTAIDGDLGKKYGDRLGARAMMGYSMGGFQTLLASTLRSTNETPFLRLDRFVALDTPVRLLHGVSVLDEYYRAPLAWPAEERTSRIRNTLLKIATSGQAGLKPQGELPLSGIESKFLIGLTFRFILRDVIYSSQRRDNQHVLQHSLRRNRRRPVYNEILGYSFQDYFEKFATPSYRSRGWTEALEAAGDLRTHRDAMQADPRLRVIVNQNDFLLSPDDLAWLQGVLGTERLKTFPRGGHLGNLDDAEVQKAILEMLSGL